MKKRTIYITLFLIFIIGVISLIGTFAIDSSITEGNSSKADYLFNITLGDRTNREITIPSYDSKIVDIKISNPNEFNISYLLYLEGINSNISIINISDTEASGVLNSKNTNLIKVFIQNNSSSDITTSIKDLVGFEKETLSLPSNSTAITKGTYYKSIVKSSNKDYGKVKPNIKLSTKNGTVKYNLVPNDGYQYKSTTCEGTVSNNILTIPNITNNISCEVVFEPKQITVNFDLAGGVVETTYTEAKEYTYTVPATGTYKIELWGAQGGGVSSHPGGYGGYSAGNIELSQNEKLYVYVGENYNGYKETLNFNGGGSGSYGTSDADNYNGGGGTDIRYFGNYQPASEDLLWNSSIGLNSRIMSAGGGGGYSSYNGGVNGANAGGLIGYSGTYSSWNGSTIEVATGGTQVSGGLAVGNDSTIPKKGAFGYGGYSSVFTATWLYAAGGGGGYYGGGAGWAGDGVVGSAAGGSSYISGHTGCVAITSQNDITPKSGCTTGTTDNSCSIHYSGKKFTNTVMIDGQGYSWTNTKGALQQMPNPSGGYYASGTGNSGNGAVKITLVDNANYKAIYNTKYSNLPTPTRTGYTFDGWYTGENGTGTKVTNDTVLKNSNTHTLYAKWVFKNVTVNFDLTGGEIETTYTEPKEHTYTVPYNGTYMFETWGAQGGGVSSLPGGYGGYSAGNIELSQNEKLYVYIGENYNGYKSTLSFNGGGSGSYSTSENTVNFNGGGATDIRLVSGDWNNTASLASRIIIAGGGGGYSNWSTGSKGGSAGGLIGYSGNRVGSIVNSTGGTQVSGGYGTESRTDTPIMGAFGIGGYSGLYSSEWIYNSGGGGGYYGGGAGGAISGSVGSASGGSSYISGHTGCVAIISQSNITPKAGCTTGTTDNSCSIHYSGKKFINTVMIDGQGYSWTNTKGTLQRMPNPSGGYYASETGNSGNGAAKITLVDNANYKVTYNTKYSNLPTPTRAGYAFDGWYTGENGTGTKVTNDTVLKNSNTHTLYAKWVFKNVTVNFDLTGGEIETTYTEPKEHTYTVPYNGTYRLDVWGAQAGGKTGGYGGYSTGYVHRNANSVLYAVVGGTGDGFGEGSKNGGYNGGGSAYGTSHNDGTDYFGSGGGGATHIATVSGLLSNVKSNMQNVLIAAGGGGGGIYIWRGYVNGGSGGGFQGVSASNGGGGATQTSNGATGGSSWGQIGGGGGGLYSGGSSGNGGGGGSGYIGNSLLSSKYMYCYNCATSDGTNTKTYTTTNVSSSPTRNYAKSGNGAARITLTGIDSYTVTYGEKYGTLPTLSKSGYTFNGWYTGANGTGTKITSGSTVSILGNHTLYAYWT